MRARSRERLKFCVPEIILEALEERIVLDATVDQQPQDHADNVSTEVASGTGSDIAAAGAASGASGPAAAAAQSETPQNSPGQVFQQNLSVVLISNAIDQIEAVSRAAADGSQVIVYDAGTDNLNTITAMLDNVVNSTGRKIGALAIVDHGTDGVVKIGVDQIGSQNIFKFVSGLEALGKDLAENAQIEFFGCSVAQGAEGQALINQIASYTHSVVFASTDATGGNSSDWTLEYSSQPGATIVPLISADAMYPSDSVLIFSGYPPIDNLATCHQYFSALDVLDLRSVETQYSYSEVWTFTLTAPTVVTIGMQTIHPELSHGQAGFVDCWLDYYSGSTPNTANRITFMDDWIGPGTTQVPDWSGNDSLPVYGSSYGVSLAAGTYCIQATSWNDHATRPQYDLVTGGYYLLSSVELTYAGGHYEAPPTSQPIPDPPAQALNFTPAYTYDIHSYFTDPQGDALTYQLGNIDYVGGLALSGLTINSTTGVVTFTSSNGASGSVEVQVRAVDGDLSSTYETFVFTVRPAYSLPSVDDASLTVAQNGSISFQVIGYDPDTHSTNQVSFSTLANYGPLHGSLTTTDTPHYDAVGKYYYQTFTYTPTAGYWGQDSFQFTLSTPGGTWRGFATSGNTIGIASDTRDTYDVALVDINSDGALDLLAANSDNNATTPGQHNYFYLNSGSGSLKDGVNMELIAGPTGNSVGMATGDLNGDGFVDVVVRNGLSGNATTTAADVIYIWDNDAHAFTPVTTLAKSAAQSRGDIALGDFDGDADLDIVRVFGTGIANEIFWNDGDGTFNATPSALPATAGTSYTCATGDFNGDGYIDIFVGKSDNSNQRHYVYFNDGSGTFTSGNAQQLPTGANRGRATDCAVGDVDRDGDLDIVLSRNNGQDNFFFKNNGNTGVYTNWAAYAITGDSYDSRGITLADVDRDGDLDAIVANFDENVRLYLFDSSTGLFATTGSDLSGGNLDALSCTTGDVDGDGDLDLVVGIDGARNQIFYNTGFNAGTTTPWHQAEPAKVSIVVNPIVNWSFENASPYSSWTMNETYETPTPPAYILPEYGTFGIVTNQPGGTTIHFGDVIHDYHDNNDQAQYSLNMETAIPGVPGITVDGSKTGHTAVILSGGLKDATLTQIFTIAQDQYLKGLELQFDLSYWNPNLTQPDGQEFTATQFVEVYLYDTTSGSPTPIWHTTNGVDSSAVGTMKHYSLKLGAADPLVTKIAGTGAQLAVEIRVCGMDWYLDAAIDDFKLVPTRRGWTLGTPSQLPPELMAMADTGSSSAEATVIASAAIFDSLSIFPLTTNSELSALTFTSGGKGEAPLSGLDSASSGTTSILSTSNSEFLLSGASFSGGNAIDVTGLDSSDSPSLSEANSESAAQSAIALSNDSDTAGSEAVASAPDSSDNLLANDASSVQASVTGEGLPTKNFDLRAAFAFDLASVSAFDVLDASIATSTPLPGMETRDLFTKIQSGASAAVSMDTIRLTDFLI